MKAIWKMSRKSKGPIYTIVNATPAEIAQMQKNADEKALTDPKSKLVIDDNGCPLWYPTEELEIEVELAFNSKGTNLFPVGSVLDSLRDAFAKERNPKLADFRMQKYLNLEEAIAEEKAELQKSRLENSVASTPDLNP